MRPEDLVAGHAAKVLWRAANSYRGATLQVTAARLDAPAQPLHWTLGRATVDPAGVSDAGYPSSITLPTAGCWTFSADLGGTTASITVSVAR